MSKSNETCLVWQVEIFGSTIIQPWLSDITGIIQSDAEELEEGDTIVIRKVRMTQKKYDSLPEFDGY